MKRRRKEILPSGFSDCAQDDAFEYTVDVLKSHGDQYSGNLPKAKALVEYAKRKIG